MEDPADFWREGESHGISENVERELERHCIGGRICDGDAYEEEKNVGRCVQMYRKESSPSL